MKDDDDVLDVMNNAWTSTGVLMLPANQPVSYFEEPKLRYDKVRAAERYTYASTARVNQGSSTKENIASTPSIEENTFSIDLASLNRSRRDPFFDSFAELSM